jgi:hypothetical protein
MSKKYFSVFFWLKVQHFAAVKCNIDKGGESYDIKKQTNHSPYIINMYDFNADSLSKGAEH